MKKIGILLSLLLITLCVGCTSGESNTTDPNEGNNGTEDNGLKEGLTLTSKQEASKESGHGDFDPTDVGNKEVTFKFHLPDTGKNNAYVNGDYTDWDIAGSENYLLNYVYENSKVFSNLYEVTLKVPNENIQLRVYLLDTEEANYSIETFDFSISDLNENKTLTRTVLSFENEVNYRYDGVLTKAPFKLYDSNGDLLTQITDTVYAGRDVTNEFSSWSLAVHYAATNSKSSYIISVKDANGLIVFERSSNTKSHVFDGDYYVGMAAKNDCLEWAFGSTKSYVISGQGTAYIDTGKIDYNGSGYNEISSHREMFSGGYNYMFSNDGYATGSRQMGYTYMSMDIDFSEAEYLPTEDIGDVWNAYLFINPAMAMYVDGTRKTLHCDMGLIASLNTTTNEVEWKKVRNSTHPSYGGTDPSFKVWHDEIITTMKWNDEKQCYSDADDLRFVLETSIDGFVLTMINLTTGVEYVLDERIEGQVLTSETEDECAAYGRMLLGISYCPVRANVWNHKNGGIFKNVIIANSEIARYETDGDYSNSVKEEFYPGSATMFNGFVQAPDTAGYRVGYYDQDGTMGVGANAITYNQGSIYTVYDIDYR